MARTSIGSVFALLFLLLGASPALAGCGFGGCTGGTTYSAGNGVTLSNGVFSLAFGTDGTHAMAGNDTRVTNALQLVNGSITCSYLPVDNSTVQCSNGKLVGLPASSNAAFTPQGGTTALTPAAIEGRLFDPRSYGAIVDGSFHSIASVLGSGVTPESVAASNPAYAWLNDPRAGVKFSVTVTTIPSSTTFTTTTTPAHYVAPAVAGVPQFNFDPQNLFKQLVPGDTLTDSTTSGVSLGTASSFVAWPVLGTSNAQETTVPGTITVTGSTSGMQVGDTIIVEVPASVFASAYTMDWLGLGSSMYAADQAGATVYLGYGSYHLGQGGLFTFGDNPIDVEGAGTLQTGLYWDTPAQIGGIYFGDGEGYVNSRRNSNFGGFTIAHINGGAAYGSAPDNGILLLVGQNSRAHDIFANGGYASIGILGDHQKMQRITAQNDFYGVFLMPFGSTNGNADIIDSSMQGNMADLGISWGAAFNYGRIGDSTYGEWGFAPHIIYKEPDFNTTIITPAMMSVGGLTNSDVNWLTAESVGGAPIELNGGNFETNRFSIFQPGMLSSLDISSESKAYFIHTTGTCGGNKFSQSDLQPDAGSWPTTAWIYCGSYQGDDWGDMTYTINRSGVAMLAGPNPSQVGGETWEDRQWQNASGSIVNGYQFITAFQNYDYNGSALGSSVPVTEGTYGGPQASRFASSSNAAIQDILGVTVGTQPTWGQPILVAREGPVSVAHETATSTTAIAGGRVYIYGPTPTAVTVSTTAANEAGPEIGTMYDASPSASATYVNINLTRH